MKTYVDVNSEQLKAFAQLPKDTPVMMLNLLKFKAHVPETGLTGAETYKNYMRAGTPFFERTNAEVLYLGKPQTMLIGPEDEKLWDKIILVKYNTISDFLGMVQADGYPLDLRAQALEDSRLIHCG